LTHDLGEFIRDLRRNARISLRQLADQAGVSNPYLSQIERGLRKPSAEVLQQLASALRVSTPLMYLRAGLLELTDGQSVPAAITVDSGLTESQKQSLIQIYETFRRENARERGAGTPVEPDPTPQSPSATTSTGAPRTTKPRTAAKPKSTAAKSTTARSTTKNTTAKRTAARRGATAKNSTKEK
jgi:transcriptional regulator with XRE-family HTH domain